MNKPKVQMRGHCSRCGGEWAVLASGKMSKHGYTVDHHYFSGVCHGDDFQPIEVNRAPADQTVKMVREDVGRAKQHAEEYKNGTRKPATAKDGPSFRAKDIPFNEATPYSQQQAVDVLERQERNRAKAGEEFADYLEGVIKEVHGKPLREVPVPPPSAPIQIGDRKVLSNGLIAAVVSVQGPRVYWKTVGERKLNSWTGTVVWRKLKDPA
jgi:hypothetical protein